MIKLTILAENRKKDVCDAESGLSIFVDTGSHKFLFDTGLSDLFLKNAEKLGVDIDNVDTIVISHGHADHSNGLAYLPNGKRVIMHPDGFRTRYSIRQKKYVAFPMSKEEAENKFDLVLTKKPYTVYDNVVFLGEIPRIIEFEGNGNIATAYDSEATKIDYTEDDSGIAIKTDDGLFIMTGCGHSGICNTIEHAKKITSESRIVGVLGGFHLTAPAFGVETLADLDDKISNTIFYFKENNIANAYLGHCIADEVINRFESELQGITKIHRLYSGAKFEIFKEPLKCQKKQI